MGVAVKNVIKAKLHIGPLKVLVPLFLIIHILLFIFDIFNPEAFLKGGRSEKRIVIVNELLMALENNTPLVPFLKSHGNAGDYILHAVVIGSFGQYGVILVQIILHIGSIILLFKIGILLTGSQRIAALSCTV
jgi:hypothetical protein